MVRHGGTKLLLTEGPGDPGPVLVSLRARELSLALLPSNTKLRNHAPSIFHVLLLTLLQPVDAAFTSALGASPMLSYHQGSKACSSMPQWPIHTSIGWLNIDNLPNELSRKKTI